MDQPPAVFLSSTFYDLRQVRVNLRDFVETSMGYRLIASEFDSFPVNPEIDTLENCRRRVENDADVFVLLVGNRYGSIPDGECRSVTNIEYLAARAIGLPIFAFINRDVLALLPLWQANPNGDFSAVVDNPQLFDFVTQVGAEDRVWRFPFDTAQDVVTVLRTQFAYQMSRGLALLKRVGAHPSEFRDLHGHALRIAAEKPKGWQPLLLAELLEQELHQLRHLRADHFSGFTPASGESLSELEYGYWMQIRCEEARRLFLQLTNTLNDTLSTACAGQDIGALVYGARRSAASYREALEWARRVRAIHVAELLRPPALILSHYMDLVIQELDGFALRLRTVVEELCSKGETSGIVKLTFTIDEEVSQAHSRALELATEEILRKRGKAR